MAFDSLNFLFIFLPIFLIVFLVSKVEYRKGLILAAGAAFYFLSQSKNLPLILGLIGVNYLVLVIQRKQGNVRTRAALFWAALTANILLLLAFKIRFTPHLMNAAPLAALASHPFVQNLTYPLGLSFIVFQILAALIDSYKTAEKTPKSLADYANYLLFFPKLILGPIARYTPFDAQLQKAEFSWARFASGAKRFIVGLAKKAIIADQLAVIVDAGFRLGEPAYPTPIAWLVIFAFFLQIYYDFSGYIDMALGIGRMIGLDLPENFNAPYLARSLADFWRRWHMTLTAWFRDYVFFPLEFKRRKVKFLRVETHTLLVFLLTGLWHGLTPNYVVWGLLQGLILIYENSRFGGWLKRLPAFFQHVYLIGAVLVSWVIFRSPTLEFAARFLARLVIFTPQVQASPYSLTHPLPIINNSVFLVLALGVIGLLPRPKFLEQPSLTNFRQSPIGMVVGDALYLTILVIAATIIAGQSVIPAIYGRF